MELYKSLVAEREAGKKLSKNIRHSLKRLCQVMRLVFHYFVQGVHQFKQSHEGQEEGDVESISSPGASDVI